jgi:hypothetical protein
MTFRRPSRTVRVEPIQRPTPQPERKPEPEDTARKPQPPRAPDARNPRKSSGGARR